METVKYYFNPDMKLADQARPKCLDCGKPIDDGSAVLDYMCRDCYVNEICVEMGSLIWETSKTVNVPQYDLLHKSGMFMAMAKFRKLAKGEIE